MNKYIIGIIMLFLLFIVFTSVNLIIGAEGEPNFVWLTMPNVIIPNDEGLTVPYSETFGKLTLKTTFSLDDFPQQNEIGREVQVPIDIYYDIYTTGQLDDVFIYRTYAVGYAYTSPTNQNAVIYRDVKTYIPYSVEYLITSLTRGYDSILDNLTNEFRQGFPTLPNGDVGIIDYVAYIGRGLFHSVTSVAVTFDFIVFPINIMRGAFV